MASTNTVIDSGVITATFTDLDGHVFSKFRINPTDLRTGERAIESADFFQGIKAESFDKDLVTQLQKDIEDKISYVLGYDSSKDIFGEVSALTVLPDGRLFVEIIVDKIMEIVGPAVKDRKEAMAKRADSYTKKYEG